MLSVPSGSGELEIALSFSQATWLAETMIREVRYAIHTGNIAASADIVALKPKRSRKGAK